MHPATFEGTAQGGVENPETTSELTLTPTITGCKTAGLNSTIELHGCKITVTGAQPEPLTALVDVASCTSGKAIEIKLVGCTITVPQQTGLSHIVSTNKEGSPDHVEAQLALKGIKYEFHGVACPGPTPGATQPAQDGDIAGKVTLKGYEDLGSESATHNGHQYSKVVDGAQTGVIAADGELHFQDESPPGAVITGTHAPNPAS